MILIVLVTFLFSGCIKEPMPKGYIQTTNINESFDLIYKMSKECFEKDAGLFSDGILIHAQNGDYTKQITFHRHAFDIGVTKPFITLNFYNNQIEVIEGTYECSYNGCVEFNIKNEILHWLSVDKTCQYKKY